MSNNLSINEALKLGIEAHRAGKLQDADRYYTAILSAQPTHPDANHNMGILAVTVGKVKEALPFLKTALEANSKTEQFWLSYVDVLIQLNCLTNAEAALIQAKENGIKSEALEILRQKLSTLSERNEDVILLKDPPRDQLQSILALYKNGNLKIALANGEKLLKHFPQSVVLLNIIGAILSGLKRYDVALDAYRKAIAINSDYADAYYNMGNALKKMGHFDKAILAYENAISRAPEDAEALNNMGIAFQEKGDSDYAIKLYRKALDIDPNYAQAYNNIGNVLQIKGEFANAIAAYDKAIATNPSYVEAHSNLSTIKKYTEDDHQFTQVKSLYKNKTLTDSEKCTLSFALTKMYEDTGDLEKALKYLSEANLLRKNLLQYSIDKDQKFFNKLKKTQSSILNNSLEFEENHNGLKPIFILGMPRSGTTLVEQIISSHSLVTGAGELDFVSLYGTSLALGEIVVNRKNIFKFRKKYLSALDEFANNKWAVSDKMPQNFMFIPLICAALPEAKIIHVHRDATATCWSNFRHYFTREDIGFCYDPKDIVQYYQLYRDLMRMWQSFYGDRIFNLNYDKLTKEQVPQTRRLIKHLGLTWEKVCLSPQENIRNVRTASQQQVRQKVYQGSSEKWKKYKPFVDEIFKPVIDRFGNTNK